MFSFDEFDPNLNIVKENFEGKFEILIKVFILTKKIVLITFEKFKIKFFLLQIKFSLNLNGFPPLF